MSRRPRVSIIRNPDKAEAEATMASLITALSSRAEVVFTGVLGQAAGLAGANPDRILVLGGDGSILAVVRALGSRQVPIVGVNFGKLGFLAEFALDDVRQHLDAILTDDGLVSRRMMLDLTMAPSDGATTRLVAVNDCVVHAGPPHRMIVLAVAVDGDHLTEVVGDGLVLATPSGSTAHTMSAGGPIVQPDVSAIVLSPLNPHSLTHRPIVFSGSSTITAVAGQVNPGTTVVVDGQVSLPMRAGDRLIVRRAAHDFQLVHHPAQPKWHTLTTKLKWGR